MDWFNTSFGWIGFIGALVLLAFMFGSDKLRSDLSVSRWCDLTWLSWAAATAYLLHNAEEYAIDLTGQVYAFPAAMCANFGYGPYPECPVPPIFFTAVNVPMFWFVGPTAALLSRRHPLVGLTLYSVISTNALVHIGGALATGTYNPGLLTAVLVFVPLSAWVVHALFGKAGLSYKAVAFLVILGVAAHAALAGPIFALKAGAISATLAAAAQGLNAAMLLVAPWLAERFGIHIRRGVEARPI
jgi:hypothetical protein